MVVMVLVTAAAAAVQAESIMAMVTKSVWYAMATVSAISVTVKVLTKINHKESISLSEMLFYCRYRVGNKLNGRENAEDIMKIQKRSKKRKRC